MDNHGDGTVTVYQIKKFASNLKKSHKRQIGESLDTLLAYLKDSEYDLREWHLVLPLDPTIENLKWFYELAPDSHFVMVWDGLTKIDGWAAQMPDVADYCLGANNGWVMELVRLHLESYRRSTAKSPLVVSCNIVAKKCPSLPELLDRSRGVPPRLRPPSPAGPPL